MSEYLILMYVFTLGFDRITVAGPDADDTATLIRDALGALDRPFTEEEVGEPGIEVVPDPSPDEMLATQDGVRDVDVSTSDPHGQMHADGCVVSANGACSCGLNQRRARWALAYHSGQLSDSELAKLRSLAGATREGRIS